MESSAFSKMYVLYTHTLQGSEHFSEEGTERQQKPEVEDDFKETVF